MFETKAIMTQNVVAVKRHTPILRAIEILVEQNITGLPVVNDDLSLAGIISEKDMLGLLVDRNNDNANVEDYMTTDVQTFNQNDDLIAICECLVNNTFRRVPILDDDGKLVGIISRKDIIKYILEPL